MKRCPQCHRVEADDSLAFCRTDGSPLEEASSEVETSLLPHTSTDPVRVRSTGPTTALPNSDFRSSTPFNTSGLQPAGSPRPHVASTRNSIIAGVIGILIVTALGVGSYLKYGRSGKQISSIAVLPFQNKSADQNTEYLSDGLAESLIYRMSQLPNLKVSPTSSVIRYKGKDVDVAKIASELGVDAVMTGRLSQIDDNLTISVELVDVRNNNLLWGEQYNRKMSDLLATQREIAAEIASKLQLELSGDAEKALTKRYTDNNDAYQLYLKGRFHLAKRNKSDVERSLEYFQQAIALDPNFAMAYSALADAYNGMTAYPYMAPKQAVPLAKAAANRALQIDPTLAGAHAAMANSLACFDWNWKEVNASLDVRSK